MANNVDSHYFHAEAHALTGNLVLPFKEEIKKQAFVKLEGKAEIVLAEGEGQNSLSQHSKNFRLEGIISYAAAHTQVSGHESKKHPGASVTLATSVVEDLNVLNVVTADRVVAQVSTTHIPKVYSPKVTFLGTHFENLRIFRHKVFPKLNLRLGEEGPKDAKQHFVQAAGFLAVVRKQYTTLNESLEELKPRVAKENPEPKLRDRNLDGLRDLPGLIERDYNTALLQGDAIEQRVEAAVRKIVEKGIEAGRREWPGIKCSLVDKIEIDTASREQVSEPITPFGHVIHVPDFGKIFLADLTVSHNSFNLTMIRLDLGCLADGNVSLVTCNVNGKGSGGH